MKNAIPSLKWHFHENSFEVTVATKGTISFCTQTSTYKFSGGDVMVSFPNEVHGTNNIPITVGELYWFQLDVSDPKNFLFLNETAASDMIAKLQAIPHHVVNADAEEIHPLLKHAFDLARNEEDPVYIASYLQLFLQHIIASSHKEHFLLSPDIGRTLNYILDNITEALPWKSWLPSPICPAPNTSKSSKSSSEFLPGVISISKKSNKPRFFLWKE